MRFPRSLFVALAMLPAAGWVQAQSPAELEAECEAARERLLAPQRQAKIDECVAQGKSAEECQRFYRDFGNASRQGGRYVERMYNDIPECVAAREKGGGER